MALIICPECGREISDKAKECVHCGMVFAGEKMVRREVRCSECGATLSEADEICPNCGCPVEEAKMDDIKLEQVKRTNDKKRRRTKKIIMSIIIIVTLFCAVGGVGYKVYLDKKAEQEYQEAFNEYITDLEKVQILMLSGGSDSEKLCNLTLKVWGNAIMEESDSETDKYTRAGSYAWNNFNIALAMLYSDSSTIIKISSIESNQSSVKQLMKKLQNPPEGLSRCYDTVTDLYEAYKKLTDLAINPSGSYRDFGENKDNVISDFMAAYEKLDNQLPDKFEIE